MYTDINAALRRLNKYRDEAHLLTKERDDAVAECQALRKALRYYANPTTWVVANDGFDMGAVARNALDAHPEATIIPNNAAPEIIMDSRGIYWRRYPDHLSMVPVSDDNLPVPYPWVVYKPVEIEEENSESAPSETLVPDDTGTRSNAGTVCDMLIGPCACGAWHTQKDT